MQREKIKVNGKHLLVAKGTNKIKTPKKVNEFGRNMQTISDYRRSCTFFIPLSSKSDSYKSTEKYARTLN